MVKHSNVMLNHMGKELREMAIFEDVVGESEDYGAIPALTKFFTAADTDFLLKKKVGCVSEIPAADEKNLGTVILLTDKQSGYNFMHFYKCIFNNGRYEWKDLNNGGAVLPCGNCTNIMAMIIDEGSTCAIKWDDPVEDDTVDQWDHTVLVRNYHHEPAGINDGVVVITCGVKNQYSKTPFRDTSIDITQEHVYYKLIPVGVKGTENTSKANAFEASAPTWNELHEMIQAGLAPGFLPKGTQISVPHSVYGTLKFTVKGYEDLGSLYPEATARIHICDRTIQHCVVLMSTYALSDVKQFDGPETPYELTQDQTFEDKTYYTKTVNSDGKTIYREATVTVGTKVPANKYYEKNPNTHPSYGSNRWHLSGLRQWLNSTGSAGTWWTKQHLHDGKPTYADDVDGFLKGFTDSDFVGMIIDLYSYTEVSGGYSDDGVSVGLETPVDKVWLPSYEQVKDFGSFGYNSASDRVITTEGGTSGREWYLRTSVSTNTYQVKCINSQGNYIAMNAKTGKYIVPCLAIA